MNIDQINKKISQASISDGMKIFRGVSFVKQHAKKVCFNAYKKLTRLQIDQGVIAFVLHCNLTGGSVGDVDLYKLVRTYLWHPEARAEINAIVRRYGL